ncbi:MAG: CoA transferase [Steroidobacteraceae bacterium]|nr:CoA transferase [Steroidobacteraceae bacterium]MBP7012610.1 CoA transferase [Steroidobacteraceae bacterium]
MGKTLPLQGIRVINFGWVWAGPVAGQTLAFLGAEVLKVESRQRIDMTRTLPPFAEGQPDPDRSLSNHACWAGNGSVSLNLKEKEARDLALDLIAHSDVVVENFGPGVMERLDLGYERLREVKPDIILFSMPAAGLYGPLEHVRTYGLSLTSLTGLDSLVGYKGGGPIPFENAFADPLAGIFGAFAILTALNHRRNTGQGQHVDFSQQEAVMQMVGPAYMDYLLNGRVGGPKGNEHPLGAAAPHSVFPCRGDDRWVSIAVQTEAEWQGLVTAMGNPDWARAERFSTMPARLTNIDALHARLAEWTAQHDDRALAEQLQRHGVAAAPVLNVGDLLHDPQYAARNTFVEVEHPLGFRETIYGAYVKMSRTSPEVRPGPAIGQDNEHAFLEILGLSEERYRDLVARRIIY